MPDMPVVKITGVRRFPAAREDYTEPYAKPRYVQSLDRVHENEVYTLVVVDDGPERPATDEEEQAFLADGRGLPPADPTMAPGRSIKPYRPLDLRKREGAE